MLHKSWQEAIYLAVMTRILKIGFWSGLLAFCFTLGYDIVQILQVVKLIPYPTDEILIYGFSLCIVLPFTIEILSFHYVTKPENQFWTHAAIIFTTAYAIFVSTNYIVQLVTVLPMKLAGRGDEIKILEQTPHSLFWNFDALGYICMGLAMLFLIPALEKNRQNKMVRLPLIANVLVTPLISVVYFYPHYSEKLLFLGFPWAITAPLAMLALALVFRKKLTAER